MLRQKGEEMKQRDQVEDRIISLMNRFGYTGNESRTYIALLRQQPATGYELATLGGIPRSAIYNVLKRLEEGGLVNVIPGKPKRYIPLPPNRLISNLEMRVAEDLQLFQESLNQVTQTQVDALTWTVSGYNSILSEAIALIDEAKELIVCSLWHHEAELLSEALFKAQQRGVPIIIFSFTSLPQLPGDILSYGISPASLEAHWTRRVIMTTDRNKALVSTAESSRLDRAVISDEIVLVETITGNLILDVTLFGERHNVDTSQVIAKLTQRVAPVESLSEKAQSYYSIDSSHKTR